jgi:hypothetical protein
MVRLASIGDFKLTGGVSTMSGSPDATRDSTALIPLVLEFHCYDSAGNNPVQGHAVFAW